MKNFVTLFISFLFSNLLFIATAMASGNTGIIHLSPDYLSSAQSNIYTSGFLARDYNEFYNEQDNDSSLLQVEVSFRNFNDCDKRKVNEAVVILEEVMNSQEFKERVLNFTFKGERRFHENNGLSNFEIYNLLMSGEEVLIPGADGVMNFDLTLYRSWNPWSKVKGYTKPDTIRIWINKKFFRRTSWTVVDVASNMAHEWVHKMGFGHAYNYNSDRPYSVPYAIGNIVGEVARELGYK